ncbi:glycosyltransferase family 4 protein [Microbacterium sp. NPDC055988]|uniref:glycosyltransferase family 4 protein n=1 Tax=Microbacterium sp. NPDC055988 TaxID=3345671 RepID=UPI0035DA22C4
MKISLLSQWYDPEPGPAALPAIYGREMIRQGHSVRALTGFPNYPDGKVHDGYRIRRKTIERRDGIDVHRVALYPQHSRSAMGRVLNYASFAASASISGRAALQGADAVWVYNSPVTVSLPLLLHTRRGTVPYFLHVQDLWPDSLIASGMVPEGWVGDRAASMISRIVKLTERKATSVGVISPGVRNLILERHTQLDPAKIVYAPNPTNEQLFEPAEEIRRRLDIDLSSDHTIDFMYAGAIGDVQGLDTVLDAAALLRDLPAVRLTIYGDGISRNRLERRVKEERLGNVRFMGRVEQHEIPELIARSHIQLVSLASSPFLRFTTPSKIPSLLASGAPIVGQIGGDGADLIRDAGAGLVVEPGDAVALADAIARMAASGPEQWQAFGESGRRYYSSHLSVASTTRIILDSLGAPRPPIQD